MTHSCRNNPSHTFDITDEDFAFYAKMEVPPPTLCPPCRMQRRLVWRNERKLYNGKCAKCGSEIISMYHPGTSYQVYCKACYYADDFDARSYGRDFDFTRPFFEQFGALNRSIPQLALNVVSNENAEYVNLSGYNKNCYLLFAGEYDENVYYAEQTIKCTSCMDTTNVYHSELVSNSVDIEQCYNVHFSYKAKNCRDGYFLFDCSGCSDCILCSNLRSAEFCIMNKKYSKEEYKKHKEAFLQQIGTTTGLSEMKRRFMDLMGSSIHRFATLVSTENATGEDLQDVKNVEYCFRVNKGEDLKYVWDGFDVKDEMDFNSTTEVELGYEGTSVGYRSYQVRFCCGAWTCRFADYSVICKSCENIFGCSNLRGASYCVLNKQYTKEEYEALVPKIIEHMRHDGGGSASYQSLHSGTGHEPSSPGESSVNGSAMNLSEASGSWGEFFPSSLSPFAYNETVAYERFPLSCEEALRQGFRWLDEEQTSAFHGTKNAVPETITLTGDDIVKAILCCETCGKNYKIIAQELKLYRQYGIALPRSCYTCRHFERIRMQNPTVLYDRTCMRCSAPIKTTYSPDRKETVYCEKCYQEAVY